MTQISKDMIIADLLEINEGIAPILMGSGMHCLGCPSSRNESLEDACLVHGIDVEELVNRLNFYLSIRGE